MKRAFDRLIICQDCKGPGFYDVFDRITEEIHPGQCTSCQGQGMVLQTITIETRAIVPEDLKKRRERKIKPIF